MRQFASVLAICAVCLSGPVTADETDGHIGEAVKKLPLFDAHIHYKEAA